jgi:hypothetical protein
MGLVEPFEFLSPPTDGGGEGEALCCSQQHCSRLAVPQLTHRNPKPTTASFTPQNLYHATTQAARSESAREPKCAALASLRKGGAAAGEGQARVSVRPGGRKPRLSLRRGQGQGQDREGGGVSMSARHSGDMQAQRGWQTPPPSKHVYGKHSRRRAWLLLLAPVPRTPAPGP